MPADPPVTVAAKAAARAAVRASASRPAGSRPPGSRLDGRANPNKPATGTATVPHDRAHAGTYVADTYSGDLTATSGGTPTLANDGEPAGLARVTLAMQPTDKQAPAPGLLVGLCIWATAIGILGALIAAWAGIELVIGMPAWFLPTAICLGVAGVGLTVAAFFTARQRIVPWALLGAASCTLGIAAYVIIVAATPVSVA